VARKRIAVRPQAAGDLEFESKCKLVNFIRLKPHHYRVFCFFVAGANTGGLHLSLSGSQLTVPGGAAGQGHKGVRSGARRVLRQTFLRGRGSRCHSQARRSFLLLFGA
jgi:hypothetical protein